MPASVQTIILDAQEDHDVEIFLPTGGRLLFQYREETGLVDLCCEPTGLTAWDKGGNGLCSASDVAQVCIGVHRDHEGRG